MSRRIDPNLASILDSIRATMGTAPDPAPKMAAIEEGSVGADPADRQPEPVPEVQPTPGDGKAARTAPASRSVEDFLADLIRPQLNQWLQENLPELVQKLAQQEIERLTGKS